MPWARCFWAFSPFQQILVEFIPTLPLVKDVTDRELDGIGRVEACQVAISLAQNFLTILLELEGILLRIILQQLGVVDCLVETPAMVEQVSEVLDVHAKLR